MGALVGVERRALVGCHPSSVWTVPVQQAEVFGEALGELPRRREVARTGEEGVPVDDCGCPVSGGTIPAGRGVGLVVRSLNESFDFLSQGVKNF